MAHNTTPSFEPDPVLVIDEVVDWAVGAIFFGIIALYCCIIFYPGKCAKMAGWVKKRHFVDFRPDMREREYGIVADEADNVELSASIHEETRQKEIQDKTMMDMMKESMV